MHCTIRMEHQIITLTVSAVHRTGQVLPSASSGSQGMLRGEAASSVCVCTTWSRKTANSAFLTGLKIYQMMTSLHLMYMLYSQACHLAEWL
jgi:hypothetical protein